MTASHLASKPSAVAQQIKDIILRAPDMDDLSRKFMYWAIGKTENMQRPIKIDMGVFNKDGYSYEHAFGYPRLPRINENVPPEIHALFSKAAREENAVPSAFLKKYSADALSILGGCASKLPTALIRQMFDIGSGHEYRGFAQRAAESAYALLSQTGKGTISELVESHDFSRKMAVSLTDGYGSDGNLHFCFNYEIGFHSGDHIGINMQEIYAIKLPEARPA